MGLVVVYRVVVVAVAVAEVVLAARVMLVREEHMVVVVVLRVHVPLVVAPPVESAQSVSYGRVTHVHSPVPALVTHN